MTSRGTRAGLLTVLTLALVALFALPSFGAGNRRRVGLRISADTLHTTFSYKDVFSKKVREKLNSGLPTKIMVQVALENEKGKAVAYWARSIEIVYDLWEESYAITVRDSRGKRRTSVKTLEEAVNVAGVLWHAPVAGHLSSLKPGIHRLTVLAEANPVSEEMIRNIQRWISRPKGGHGEHDSRSNFFGSFVGHFVDRDIGRADKAVVFTSQPFALGQEPAK